MQIDLRKLKKAKKSKSANNEKRIIVGASSGVREQILTIDQFCQQFEMNEAKVWELISKGKLFARVVDEKVSIFTKDLFLEEKLDKKILEDLHQEISNQKYDLNKQPDIKALNLEDTKATNLQGSLSKPIITKSVDHQNNYSLADISSFMNFLTATKQENQQILSLTQQSVQQMQNMLTKIEELNSEVLMHKKSENEDLKKELQNKQNQIDFLKQEIEDLKMLASMIE